jgi:arylsulfatase A-like enzyme
MTRRTALSSLALAGTAPFISRCGRGKSTPRPNILFIMTDDQAHHEMSCAGNPLISTPNMDRLAREGVRFANSFCTNSLCAPSRASVLTGCYSNVNGIRGNSESRDNIERINPALPTFPRLLREAGYRTALIGKIHLNDNPGDLGFDDWKVLPGQGVYFDCEFIENDGRIPSKGYVTDVITDKALAWLEKRDRSRPFCLVYQHKGPHRPFTPAPRHTHLYDEGDFPCPETFDDDYATRRIAGLAADMRFDISLAGDYPDLPKGLDPREKKKWIYQRFVKDHYRATVGVDENLGRVLDYLDAEGIAEDTLVMYTSDNGFFLGEHGWYDKRFMYEPSLRIPLLVRYPRLGFTGAVIGDMALNVDFAPTILDLAGVSVPPSMHGRSLRPLLEGAAQEDWRKSMYYAYYENSWKLAGFKQEDLSDPSFTFFTAHRVSPHHGVRTDRWKLIEYYSEGDYRELFDLQNDPQELTNRAGSPECADIERELTAELRRMQKIYGDAPER